MHLLLHSKHIAPKPCIARAPELVKWKIDRGSWLVSDVYFGRTRIYGGVFSALFVLSQTNGARRTTGTGTGIGTGTGMGTTGRTRAEIPTAHLLCAAANS